MTLKQRLTDDMKAAMRGADKPRLAVIRSIQAAIKQREVDERIELDDAGVLAVLEKQAKQRRESIAQFTDGGRQDLADKEAAELEVIQAYLPEPLAEAELDRLIADAIGETGAASLKDMGRVMALVKGRAAGRADMSAVSARVKAKLGG